MFVLGLVIRVRVRDKGGETAMWEAATWTETRVSSVLDRPSSEQRCRVAPLRVPDVLVWFDSTLQVGR